MREIKFRTWDVGKKQMIGPYEIGSLFAQECGFNYDDKKCGTYLMQFTGLLDKNGKDIFEGDIILKDGIYFEIIWNRLNASFYCKPKRLLDRKLRPGLEGFDEVELYEVVGNIYENPELMEKKTEVPNSSQG